MSQIRFHVHYIASHEDYLQVVLLHIKGSQVREITIPMCQEHHVWTGLFETDHPMAFSYRYEVKRGNEVIRKEFGYPHRHKLTDGDACTIVDEWISNPLYSVLQRDIFTKSIYAPATTQIPIVDLEGKHLLRLYTFPPSNSQYWAVVGSSESLGSWDPQKALPLTRTDIYEWSIALSPHDVKGGVEYKFILCDKQPNSAVVWEEGANRILPFSEVNTDIHVYFPRMQLQMWRGAGIVLPIFSLRSENSMGVGDFGDLRSLIAWAKKVRMKCIQTLPINDTTRTGTDKDSYPYSAISVFALHPIYVDASQWKDSKAYQHCYPTGQKLNALQQVNYALAFALKMEFFARLFEERGKELCAQDAYTQFCTKNEVWLTPYVHHCVERDEQLLSGTNIPIFLHAIAPVPKEKRYIFYQFIQFILYQQLLSVHEYARKSGVMLKGDIPIGVDPDSISVKEKPELFHFHVAAGAPPDAFAVDGQNWGFPTYNWKEMSKDNYAWWRARIDNMSLFFDAYRIDHVLGFFRIWEIPNQHISGLLGHFSPALPFSLEEIKTKGFDADVEALTLPGLTMEAYEDLQSKWANEDLTVYFEKKVDHYYLRPQYRSQQQIKQVVLNSSLKNELLHIATNVLWIRDEEQKEKFHPRILGSQTLWYTTLSQQQQEAYNALYEDFYFHRHENYWKKEALKKLPVIASAEQPMLPCAEDLGMVPHCVPEVLSEMHIFSLQIETMPKTYGQQFDDTANYPIWSVATISTHDMPPFRLWWKRNPQAAQSYWHKVLRKEGKAPKELPAHDMKKVVERHLQSPSMLCLLSFQDWMAIDELNAGPCVDDIQINNPANPNQIWNYRMHLTIEKLNQLHSFNELLTKLIYESKRN